MTFVLTTLLAVLITVTDITCAWLYSQSSDHWGIEVLRLTREALTLGLAAWGLSAASRLGAVLWTGLAYAVVILGYLLFNAADVEFDVAAASAVKLLLPVILVLVGAGGLNTSLRFGRFAVLLAALATASTAFGAWDINNTGFWTDTLNYGGYLNGVKGIVMGYDSYHSLPFNFFGYEEQRRAAGLVAAPLAQGSMVAVGTLVAFAALHRKNMVFATLVLAIGLLGVWQSGTRGAMLMLAIGLMVFLSLSGLRAGMLRNLFVLCGLILVSYESATFVYSYSANLDDGSTVGHLDALQSNLADLGTIVLAGPGLGAAGSVAADEGLVTAGGGEGAIFAIAYQTGLPSALVFLTFFALACLVCFRGRHLPGTAGELSIAAFALGLGVATTFISSDHIFTLSGMGLYWIFLGGALVQKRPDT